MRIEQRLWSAESGWSVPMQDGLGESAHLVLAFGGRSVLSDRSLREQAARFFPAARFFGCTTAGEVHGARVFDGALSLTAVHFQHTRIQTARVNIADTAGSREAGAMLASRLVSKDLKHVLVLSDGLLVNGSELARGLVSGLPATVGITGGMAGDGVRFEDTMVLDDDGPASGAVAAVGFYSDRLRVGYGSMGGWDPFGPDRLITRSEGNVLRELDGRCALDLYKTYLGKHAEGLPATGLFFPLCVRSPEEADGLVRTILSVDETTKTMVFAGDVPEGKYARLMKANLDRLLDGSRGAAAKCLETGPDHPELALLISCIGRKLVLGQRIEEEVETVGEELGGQAVLAGFYSYGEIAPRAPGAESELHNQTMTITTFSER